MVSATSLSFMARTYGNVIGCIAKQCIVFHGFKAVLREVDRCVQQAAQSRFTSWLGVSLAETTTESLALPVVSLIGDVTWNCITDAISAIVIVGARSSGYIAEQTKTVSLAAVTAARVVAAFCGYVAKFVITNYVHPLIQVGLRTLSKEVLPLLLEYPHFQGVVKPLISGGLELFAPSLTVLLADISGFLISEVFFYFAKQIILAHQQPAT